MMISSAIKKKEKYTISSKSRSYAPDYVFKLYNKTFLFFPSCIPTGSDGKIPIFFFFRLLRKVVQNLPPNRLLRGLASTMQRLLRYSPAGKRLFFLASPCISLHLLASPMHSTAQHSTAQHSTALQSIAPTFLSFSSPQGEEKDGKRIKGNKIKLPIFCMLPFPMSLRCKGTGGRRIDVVSILIFPLGLVENSLGSLTLRLLRYSPAGKRLLYIKGTTFWLLFCVSTMQINVHSPSVCIYAALVWAGKYLGGSPEHSSGKRETGAGPELYSGQARGKSVTAPWGTYVAAPSPPGTGGYSQLLPGTPVKKKKRLILSSLPGLAREGSRPKKGRNSSLPLPQPLTLSYTPPHSGRERQGNAPSTMFLASSMPPLTRRVRGSIAPTFRRKGAFIQDIIASISVGVSQLLPCAPSISCPFPFLRKGRKVFSPQGISVAAVGHLAPPSGGEWKRSIYLPAATQPTFIYKRNSCPSLGGKPRERRALSTKRANRWWKGSYRSSSLKKESQKKKKTKQHFLTPRLLGCGYDNFYKNYRQQQQRQSKTPQIYKVLFSSSSIVNIINPPYRGRGRFATTYVEWQVCVVTWGHRSLLPVGEPMDFISTSPFLGLLGKDFFNQIKTTKKRSDADVQYCIVPIAKYVVVHINSKICKFQLSSYSLPPLSGGGSLRGHLLPSNSKALSVEVSPTHPRWAALPPAILSFPFPFLLYIKVGCVAAGRKGERETRVGKSVAAGGGGKQMVSGRKATPPPIGGVGGYFVRLLRYSPAGKRLLFLFFEKSELCPAVLCCAVHRRCKEMQGDARRCKEMQGDARRCKEMQGIKGMKGMKGMKNKKRSPIFTFLSKTESSFVYYKDILKKKEYSEIDCLDISTWGMYKVLYPFCTPPLPSPKGLLCSLMGPALYLYLRCRGIPALLSGGKQTGFLCIYNAPFSLATRAERKKRKCPPPLGGFRSIAPTFQRKGRKGNKRNPPFLRKVGAMLCCTVLCCAVLCCAVLCCASEMQGDARNLGRRSPSRLLRGPYGKAKERDAAGKNVSPAIKTPRDLDIPTESNRACYKPARLSIKDMFCYQEYYGNRILAIRGQSSMSSFYSAEADLTAVSEMQRERLVYAMSFILYRQIKDQLGKILLISKIESRILLKRSMKLTSIKTATQHCLGIPSLQGVRATWRVYNRRKYRGKTTYVEWLSEVFIKRIEKKLTDWNNKIFSNPVGEASSMPPKNTAFPPPPSASLPRRGYIEDTKGALFPYREKTFLFYLCPFRSYAPITSPKELLRGLGSPILYPFIYPPLGGGRTPPPVPYREPAFIHKRKSLFPYEEMLRSLPRRGGIVDATIGNRLLFLFFEKSELCSGRLLPFPVGEASKMPPLRGRGAAATPPPDRGKIKEINKIQERISSSVFYQQESAHLRTDGENLVYSRDKLFPLRVQSSIFRECAGSFFPFLEMNSTRVQSDFYDMRVLLFSDPVIRKKKLIASSRLIGGGENQGGRGAIPPLIGGVRKRRNVEITVGLFASALKSIYRPYQNYVLVPFPFHVCGRRIVDANKSIYLFPSLPLPFKKRGAFLCGNRSPFLKGKGKGSSLQGNRRGGGANGTLVNLRCKGSGKKRPSLGCSLPLPAGGRGGIVDARWPQSDHLASTMQGGDEFLSSPVWGGAATRSCIYDAEAATLFPCGEKTFIQKRKENPFIYPPLGGGRTPPKSRLRSSRNAADLCSAHVIPAKQSYESRYLDYLPCAATIPVRDQRGEVRCSSYSKLVRRMMDDKKGNKNQQNVIKQQLNLVWISWLKSHKILIFTHEPIFLFYIRGVTTPPIGGGVALRPPENFEKLRFLNPQKKSVIYQAISKNQFFLIQSEVNKLIFITTKIKTLNIFASTNVDKQTTIQFPLDTLTTCLKRPLPYGEKRRKAGLRPKTADFSTTASSSFPPALRLLLFSFPFPLRKREWFLQGKASRQRCSRDASPTGKGSSLCIEDAKAATLFPVGEKTFIPCIFDASPKGKHSSDFSKKRKKRKGNWREREAVTRTTFWFRLLPIRERSSPAGKRLLFIKGRNQFFLAFMMLLPQMWKGKGNVTRVTGFPYVSVEEAVAIPFHICGRSGSFLQPLTPLSGGVVTPPRVGYLRETFNQGKTASGSSLSIPHLWMRIMTAKKRHVRLFITNLPSTYYQSFFFSRQLPSRECTDVVNILPALPLFPSAAASVPFPFPYGQRSRQEASEMQRERASLPLNGQGSLCIADAKGTRARLGRYPMSDAAPSGGGRKRSIYLNSCPPLMGKVRERGKAKTDENAHLSVLPLWGCAASSLHSCDTVAIKKASRPVPFRLRSISPTGNRLLFIKGKEPTFPFLRKVGAMLPLTLRVRGGIEDARNKSLFPYGEKRSSRKWRSPPPERGGNKRKAAYLSPVLRSYFSKDKKRKKSVPLLPVEEQRRSNAEGVPQEKKNKKLKWSLFRLYYAWSFFSAAPVVPPLKAKANVTPVKSELRIFSPQGSGLRTDGASFSPTGRSTIHGEGGQIGLEEAVGMKIDHIIYSSFYKLEGNKMKQCDVKTQFIYKSKQTNINKDNIFIFFTQKLIPKILGFKAFSSDNSIQIRKKMPGIYFLGFHIYNRSKKNFLSFRKSVTRFAYLSPAPRKRRARKINRAIPDKGGDATLPIGGGAASRPPKNFLPFLHSGNLSMKFSRSRLQKDLPGFPIYNKAIGMAMKILPFRLSQNLFLAFQRSLYIGGREATPPPIGRVDGQEFPQRNRLLGGVTLPSEREEIKEKGGAAQQQPEFREWVPSLGVKEFHSYGPHPLPIPSFLRRGAGDGRRKRMLKLRSIAPTFRRKVTPLLGGGGSHLRLLRYSPAGKRLLFTPLSGGGERHLRFPKGNRLLFIKGKGKGNKIKVRTTPLMLSSPSLLASGRRSNQFCITREANPIGEPKGTLPFREALRRERSQSAEIVIAPAPVNIRHHLEVIRKIIHECKTSHQWYLIKKISPIIRSWSLYFKIINSKLRLFYCDYIIFKMLWRWACRRHPKKKKSWIKKKYFKSLNGKNWVFCYKKKKTPVDPTFLFICLPIHSDINLAAAPTLFFPFLL